MVRKLIPKSLPEAHRFTMLLDLVISLNSQNRIDKTSFDHNSITTMQTKSTLSDSSLNMVPTSMLGALMEAHRSTALLSLVISLKPQNQNHRKDSLWLWFNCYIKTDDFEVIRILIENGAEVNVKCNGLTPLHLAATYGI